MLVIESVSKTLGSKGVLRRVSLRCERPGVTWIRGRNGCGKSTLLKCVVGIWRADEGDVFVCGRSTVRDGQARLQVGYVPDNLGSLPDLSVMEMLALVAALKRCAFPSRELLTRFGVDLFGHQSVATLSAGQSRRFALLAALLNDPWLLVLDEPTTGLDAAGVTLLSEIIQERTQQGRAALMVTHDQPFAEALGAEAYDVVDGSVVRAIPSETVPRR